MSKAKKQLGCMGDVGYGLLMIVAGTWSYIRDLKVVLARCEPQPLL